MFHAFARACSLQATYTFFITMYCTRYVDICQWGRQPHSSSGSSFPPPPLPLVMATQTAGDNLEERVACVRHEGNASEPELPHSVQPSSSGKILMVSSFHCCGTSPPSDLSQRCRDGARREWRNSRPGLLSSSAGSWSGPTAFSLATVCTGSGSATCVAVGAV